MDTDNSRRRSAMWKHFTRKNNSIASCNVCKKDYSYKASITNLAKHWRKFHSDENDTDISGEEHSDDSDEDIKHSIKDTVSKSAKSTWQYFEVVDNDKYTAKCKVCEMEVSYDSVSDLRDHAREHDAVISDDEDWGENTGPVRKYRCRKSNKSKVWQYMQITDEIARNAMCVICKKSLSYLSTMNNLRKHLQRIHPHVNIDDEDTDVETSKVLISQDGQLYEVATSDGERDPIQTSDIYIDDSNDGNILSSFTSTHIKKEKKAYKRKFTAKEPIPKTNNNIVSVINTDKNTHLNTRNVITNNSTPMGSIDYFGLYIVSLLKEMPQHVAGQLQSDIIKQIFTAKMAAETPLSVTLSEKPVTVTINNDTDIISEVTVNNTSDVVAKENDKK